MSVARMCAYDRPKADIYANVRINNPSWKFGLEEKYTLQGVPFFVSLIG
jgi:hypothetical protein